MVTKKKIKKDTRYAKKALKGNKELAKYFAEEVVVYMLRKGPENGAKAWHKAVKKLRKLDKRSDVDMIIDSWAAPTNTPEKNS